MRNVEDLLRRLTNAGFQFVVVGGFAAVAHGATRLTQDIDLCGPLSRENVAAHPGAGRAESFS